MNEIYQGWIYFAEAYMNEPSNIIKTHYYLADFYGADKAVNAFKDAMTSGKFVEFDVIRLNEMNEIKNRFKIAREKAS